AVRYSTADADLPVLRDVSLRIDAGEIVGVVGESGCGKSTLSSAILRLLPPNGAIVDGAIRLGDRELTALPAEEMRRLRGPEIAMVFLDPLSSLNPVFTVWAQIRDAIRAHATRGGFDAKALRTRTAATLTELGIPDAERRLDDYPHQFSGGMRQRIVIAMALLLEPRLLIADEPTSALDATMQAQIVSILARLRRERDMAIMFVTHDLALVSHLCERVVVMYAGIVVEEGPVSRVFRDPVHPYTAALLRSIPSRHEHVDRLATIPGSVPSLSDLPVGCPFADRCDAARATCRASVPAVREQDGRAVRCFAGDPTSTYAADPPAVTAEAGP
ncbi:MAG: ABC transporter ATP-binding protein, partial [Actinomycetota bacterium]